MLTSHFVLPLAPRLSPEAPTTCGMLDVSKSFRFNFLYIFQDIMLFMAPVSKKCVNFLCLNCCLQMFGILCLLLGLVHQCCRCLASLLPLCSSCLGCIFLQVRLADGWNHLCTRLRRCSLLLLVHQKTMSLSLLMSCCTWSRLHELISDSFISLLYSLRVVSLFVLNCSLVVGFVFMKSMKLLTI